MIVRFMQKLYVSLNFNYFIGIVLVVSFIVSAPLVSGIQSSLSSKTKQLFTDAPITVENHSQYDEIVYRAAALYDVDPILIKAVILVESDFRPKVTSPKGALGLMQLMPGTARMLGVKDSFDPEENIMAGTRFLSYLIHMFEHDVVKALAAYNAGPNSVKRYGAIPPYAETRAYIKKVVKQYKQFVVQTTPEIG